MQKLLRIFCLLGVAIVSWPLSAQDLNDEALVEAYRTGYMDGWHACYDAGCGGTTGPGTGTSASYELPPAIFPSVSGAGTRSSVEVPSDWFVMPSASGQGVYGRLQADGTFRPYVVKSDGEIELLDENQLPIWTTDPDVREAIAAFPRGADGTVFVPVQPLMER